MTARNRLTSLKRRIRQFYDLMNQKDVERCHGMVDPRIHLQPKSVTLFQYGNTSRDPGTVRVSPVLAINIDLHLDEPNQLYEGRDFTAGQTTWADQAGGRHRFSERWVREGRVWYTRSTGFVTPMK